MCEEKGLEWKRRRKLELIEMLEVQEGKDQFDQYLTENDEIL